MFTVRFATLSDAAGISQVHCSDIEQWYRGHFDEDGKRVRVPAAWEDCALIDRWEMGGAWMSPELCAIHLNRLLLEQQIPLVAELDGKIVGELEIFIGNDDIYGLNANLSVLYVHKDYRGQGIGSALLSDAIELVRGMGCDTLTTYNPDVPEYYARFGLTFERVLNLAVIPSHARKTPFMVRRENLPVFSRLQSLDMLSGRILSNFQLYWQLNEETEPGAYAIPAAWRPKEHSYTLGRSAERSYLLLRDRSGGGAWATVHLWGALLSPALIETTLSVGKRLGFEALHFIVDKRELSILTPYLRTPAQEATVIHCLKL